MERKDGVNEDHLSNSIHGDRLGEKERGFVRTLGSQPGFWKENR